MINPASVARCVRPPQDFERASANFRAQAVDWFVVFELAVKILPPLQRECTGSRQGRRDSLHNALRGSIQCPRKTSGCLVRAEGGRAVEGVSGEAFRAQREHGLRIVTGHGKIKRLSNYHSMWPNPPPKRCRYAEKTMILKDFTFEKIDFKNTGLSDPLALRSLRTRAR